MYVVSVTRAFSAAHAIADIGGKCEGLHGHNFTVEVSVSATELNNEGLAVDFRDLKRWTDEVLEELDHKYLNEIDYFKDRNPSSELIAKFIFDKIAGKANSDKIRVSQVSVWESNNSRALYLGTQ